MEFFNQSTEQAVLQLKTTKEGLDNREIRSRQETHGKNKLAEEKKKGVLQIFLEQFKDLLIAILIVAGIVSAISGQLESTAVIFSVIILNAILGTVQYFKAEKTLDGLKRLSAPIAKVIRNGVRQDVASEELVPGDILVLEAGDLVTADARIIENYSLKVNESSLTGESEPVEKTDAVIQEETVPLGDRKNMVFSGSLVTYGRAIAVVTGTGMHTELGKIAALLNRTAQRKTPLQISMDKFSQKLAFLIIAICIAVFGLSLYNKMPMIDALLFAVALAVAAIPEALSSIITIVLAIGTSKMAQENAVIKDLKAVESLGCVSVICSDKTGTLTQNRMEVQELFADGNFFRAAEIAFSNQAQYMLLKEAILVNDASILDGKELGDPTETALISMAEEMDINTESYRQQHPRIAEIAFDSDRKLMSTVHEMDGKNILCTKGAVDVILGRVKRMMTADGVRDITQEDLEKITDANRQLSEKGLRVLCVAARNIGKQTEISREDETDFIFVGLISMMDPPRPEAIQAVADAKRGGIKTVMITGDHKITASAIAKQIGIMEEGDLAVEGTELDAMSDEELAEKLERIRVYARVSPEHKIRIVRMWQEKGKIASMTGDGVNDAPALKRADIGVAMGITGTEVAKDAASMILTDDNFATIVKAVINGRGVYANIKNSIGFLLSGNTAGIIAVLLTSLLGLPVPFMAVHLLFINLLTDSLPAIAIGMEPTGDNLLNDKPRNPKESILNKKTLLTIGAQGLLIGISTLVAYFIGLKQSPELARTMAFATLTLARLFHGFNCRGDRSVFKLKFTTNRASIGAFFLGVLLLALVLFVPALQGLFSVSVLTAMEVGYILILAFVPTVLIQIWKLIRH
ncbi:MAG: cation-translocating P-type ATPase [Clostridia bacterium]|nr:cation-translocating P-type ATPase [Clostridia bacterium]